MTTTLPVIPRPEHLTIAEARDVCASVVQWANECDDAETVLRAREAFRVVAEYLRINDAAREGEAAMRYLEMRIGELAGPAAMGRPTGDGKLPSLVTNDLHHGRLHDFRKMAAHPDVVEQVIAESSQQSPPSRNKVLNAIRELERAANEAKAENDAFKAGLAEQREWAATFKAKDGDDWKRRERAQLATISLIDAIRAFTGRISPADLAYALETGFDHVAAGFRDDLVDCFELLDPYREVLP